ncbi:MAG: DNA-processing protein DprA [Candidatus Planktophila sp.]|nr:DNA-processing protein DprA [Candidatus Planktophila sp.]
MKEREARAILFSAIEGGHSLWAREIFSQGAVRTLERLLSGSYDVIKYSALIASIKATTADQVFEKVKSADALLLMPGDAMWPSLVDDLIAPPIALIAKGNLAAISMQSLAIVGTRNPTNYGARIAGDFAAGFVDREWAIVSGGAYGIDTFAHKGALIAEGVTVAVIASGIDINYPAGNSRLFAEICETGAIVSEVMPGHPALPARFLTRNRLIAALSQATLVVEAAFRSGSLRTARDAAELLRPVMAIPGPINSPTSEGCHRLIGERAAEIVTSVADAVEFVGANR